MKKTISSLLLVGALSSVSTAAIISINFTRHNPTSSTDLTSGDSAGVEVASNWTNIDGSLTSGTNLQTNSGASTVDFARTGASASAFHGGAVNESSFNSKLMSDYTDVHDTAVTWTFSDLNANGFSTYDVIVYTSDGYDTRFGNYTIGATTIKSGDRVDFDSSDDPAFVESTEIASGGNYVRFRGITGDSFAISAIGANGGTKRAPVNGFQIVAVPEPSSTALLGLGGLALILRRRK